MSTIHFSSSLSTVNFCDKRLDPKEANTIMAKHEKDCLAPEKNKRYIQLAHEGNYPEVLGAIWKDKDNRLSFLRQLAPELHGVLLFELGMAEFLASKTVETVNLVVLPLFKAAIFRIRQDARCSQDPSVSFGDADERLAMVYSQSLDTATKKYLGQSLEQIQTVLVDQRRAAFVERLRQTALASKTTELPSPKWIGFHGMQKFISGDMPMHSYQECKRIRDAFADKLLEDIK